MFKTLLMCCNCPKQLNTKQHFNYSRALCHCCLCEKPEQWEEEVGWLPGKFPNGMGPESEGPEWGATRPPWYPKEGGIPHDIVLPDIEVRS